MYRLSCVVNGTDKMAIQPAQTAVVIGAGPIGLLHGLLYKAAGARVIISDLAPARLDIARRIGLDVVLNGQEQNLVVAAPLTAQSTVPSSETQGGLPPIWGSRGRSRRTGYRVTLTSWHGCGPRPPSQPVRLSVLHVQPGT